MTRYRSTLAAAFSMAACFGGVSAYADDVVTIGIISATTGPMAAPGSYQINGFKLAEEDINKSGGVKIGDKTYRVALKIYDSRCNVAEGAAIMERLASVDKVPITLGELCTPVAAAEAPIAQEYKVPLILTVPTADNLTTQGNSYLFRVNAPNAAQNRMLVDFIVARNLSPVAELTFNNDTGRGAVAGRRAILPETIKSGYIGFYNVGEVDFSSHITNIRNSGAKAVVLGMDEEAGALAIKQIRDAGLDVQIIGTLAMDSDRFLHRLNANYVAGMVQGSAFALTAPGEKAKTFTEAYKARFGAETHAFAAQSYDGLMIAVEAMRKAASVSDGEAIRNALATIAHHGVTGELKFDKNNQATPLFYVTQWCKDGTRQIAMPHALAAACSS
ncbi:MULTISPECIES: ABC transporter substrate-binding protein [unclassified Chelatococcus]|uniref:ABC transporter substrate-binding protein n=1 Tax=unclassified Chelatococcus TaxID=2638111 RepID=UPI001BD03A71|nr:MULTISPECIES: ABC transporter substrate-binding protein [unclassified Chelatococcus]MBS7700729.1 ABC transporter substrate-binding protein [Chelatococcus sp. YT9]MBX3559313.1 ABC transporter substrate-binding protein [Chelatococcus sp.]